MAAPRPGTQPGQVTISFGQFGGLLSTLFIAAGLLAIGIGADRIRSNGLVAAQLPYILTGGMLGMSLVIIGAALMIVQKSREDRAAMERRLEGLVEAVLAGGGGGGAAVPSQGAPRDVSGLVVAGSASYHLPGCRLVDGRETVTYLTPGEALTRDLKPCRVCQPDAEVTEVRTA